MTTQYRITADVIRDGEPFTTEPEFGATVDEAKARLLEWIHECGWAFVGWHDLFQIDEVPLGYGSVTHNVTQLELRGNMADKMNEFIPGVVDGQLAFCHVAPDSTVSRWWLVPGSPGSPTSHHPSVTDHRLGLTPRPGWYSSDGSPLPCDPREASQ